MDTAASREEAPFHLQGNFAPVAEEVTATDLPVQGALPPELCGLYVRNGPNPRSGRSPHWFLGDGMLHGVALEAGRAAWYRNRWVRTRPFVEGEDRARLMSENGRLDHTVARANTHVIRHAGRILALVESSFPTEVTPELETVGIHDFGGRLTTAMTAHPKICPRTGEMHFFGYGFSRPYLTYHVADAAGTLVHSAEIELPAPVMIHDFAITDRDVIFLDLPVVFSAERALQGTMPFAWSDAHGARVGVLPRRGTGADVRWMEIEPCYVFHPRNAWREGDAVVLDAARYPELWRATAADFRTATLHRWRIDPGKGRVDEEPLDDRGVEFPRVDARREGLPHRYGYAVRYEAGPDGAAFHALVQHDLARGTVRQHDFGAARTPGEAVFAPASPAAGEDEGWVLSLVYDAGRDASDLVVLDASRFDAPPVATVPLPQRVPFGFHGSWLPA